MSVPITVTINERGPAAVRMRHRYRSGQVLELERDDPYLTASQEAAWSALLEQGRRLPAGTIEVAVAEDEWGRAPAPTSVGAAIAQAA